MASPLPTRISFHSLYHQYSIKCNMYAGANVKIMWEDDDKLTLVTSEVSRAIEAAKMGIR